MMNSLRYKHVLFDLDGTIFDTREADLGGLLTQCHKYFENCTETFESLDRFFGIPGRKTIELLGVKEEDRDTFYNEWVAEILKKKDTVKIFDGILTTLKILKEKGCKFGIITSRTRGGSGLLADSIPLPIREFFNIAICANDVPNPKPHPDSILRYIEITKAKREEILFIGDAHTDCMCANSAGIDFGLALWGFGGKQYIRCAHYFKNPFEIISAATYSNLKESSFYDFAREINAIGAIGLAYTKDKFDIERYERLQELSALMMTTYSTISFADIKESFIYDKSYPTPKIETRAAIFNNKGEILLVKEANGLYTLPGGWCDTHLSVAENAIKEVKEEAGLDCYVVKLIALLDRKKHNKPDSFYGITKVFLQCALGDGDFIKNNETIDREFFSRDNLPDNLRVSTTTKEQLLMCFDAYENKDFQVIVE